MAKILILSGNRQRQSFVPLTGNPENGDYLDWFRQLKAGEVKEFSPNKNNRKKNKK